MSDQSYTDNIENDNQNEIFVFKGNKEQDLINSCKTGNLDEVKHLVGSGVSLKYRDEQGLTPFHWAVRKNHKEVAEWLLRSGACVTDKDECGRMAFHFAERKKLRDILREADPAAYSAWEKEQDLIKVCWRGELDKAKLLVDSGVSVNCTDEAGMTPLHWAAFGGCVEVVDWLFRSAASLGDKDECGRKPLHLAASNEMIDFFRNVDLVAFKDWESEQGLIKACNEGDLDEAKRLVESGVSVKCRDKDGNTPMHHAVSNGHLEVAEWLFLAGASVDDRNRKGETYLMLAVSNESYEISRLLLDRGCSVDERDIYGHTELMVAVSNNNKEMSLLLLEADADLTCQNNFGDTSLSFAVSNNNEEMVRFLIDKTAAEDEKDVMNCLEYGQKHGFSEIVTILKKEMRWLSRRDFIMFLATQSYLPAAPPPLADSMSSDELSNYNKKFHNPDTRPNTAVHLVFFMEELQIYITSFLGQK